jgi:hypothetical protein
MGADGMADDLDLDPIRARAEAATEGPWASIPTVHGDPHVQTGEPVDESGCAVIVAGFPRTRRVALWTSPSDYGRADAEFIAAARADVPALIAEVERLQGERDEARSLTESLSIVADGMESARNEALAERDDWRTRHLETNGALVDALAAAESLRAQLATVKQRTAAMEQHAQRILGLYAPGDTVYIAVAEVLNGGPLAASRVSGETGGAS